MVSRLQSCSIFRRFRWRLNKTYIDTPNIQTFPRCFCTAVVCEPKNYCFNIQEINTNHFSNLIPETKSALKFSDIVSEIQTLVKYKSNRFPQFLNSDEILKLCSLETRTQRKSYLAYLRKKENYRKKALEEKENKQFLKQQKPKLDPNSYGLGRNSLILQVRQRSIKRFYNKKLANAALFGEKIVLDLSYDEFMTDKEKQYTAQQLKLVHTANRQNSNPYDVYFCNSNDTSNVKKYLKKCIQGLENSLLTVTDSSYLDVFPRERLVYLSPHAEETMREYDHGAVYIIGAFVDTIKKTKVSFNKANLEGIRSYSLPLDDYVMWGAGSKSLTINQVFEIMLTMKNTGDWKKAFKVIPQRKIRKIDSEQANNELPDKIHLVYS